MSSPPFAPGAHPWPSRLPAAHRPAPAMPKRLRWGVLEWYLVAQAVAPALLFVPGISAARLVLRIAVFVMPLALWFAQWQSGRSRSGADTFPPTTCLKLASGWLMLMLLHPSTYSPPAGLIQALFYIAVFSPAFWAPGALSSPRQVGRLMAIILVFNALSALIGLGQVFRPGTFNPPVIPALAGSDEDSMVFMVLAYKDASGRSILRPCGLSDSPGAAGTAGAAAVLAGLAFALRPIGWIRRMAGLGAAFAGMAVIYYSQVRMIFLMEIICLAVLIVVFVLQKNFSYATLLGGLGSAMVVGALSWVIATSGQVVVERFLGLAQNDFGKTYKDSGRAGFVQQALTVTIWEEPLGQGIGRWGTIAGTFGGGGNLWVEVMIPGWVADGGIPLLLLYNIAIALAMIDTFRVALRSRDAELRFWAAVVFSSNLSAIATCFSYVTFLTNIGMQFWFLAAVVHAADVRVRREAAARARAAAPGPATRPGPPPRPWEPPA